MCGCVFLLILVEPKIASLLHSDVLTVTKVIGVRSFWRFFNVFVGECAVLVLSMPNNYILPECQQHILKFQECTSHSSLL